MDEGKFSPSSPLKTTKINIWNFCMRFRKLKKLSKQLQEQKHENKEAPIYAKFADRTKAFIIDMFMIYGPIIYIIAYAFMDGKDEFKASSLAPLVGVTIYGLIYSVLLAKFGQTPGKKAYEIKVVKIGTLENISLLRALFRYVAFLFTAATLLGLFLPFFRKDKRALHDLISSTIVVATNNK